MLTAVGSPDPMAAISSPITILTFYSKLKDAPIQILF